jgi:DNA-binding MarR family transcriptional regulator
MRSHLNVNLDAIAWIGNTDAMKNEPTKAAVGTWIRLMRAQQKALLKVERAFRKAGLPSYAWYDALWQLEQAGEQGLRPREIEQQVLIAQSNISRLIDRMESDGYVVRRPYEGDGRGQIVVITEKGRVLRKRMWPIYAEMISTIVSSKVSDRDAANLSGFLDRLIESSD